MFLFNPLVDEPSPVARFCQFSLGVLFFPFVFRTVAKLLRETTAGRNICNKYNIKRHGVYDISNKATSSTFAVLACSCGLHAMSNCTGDIMKERRYILENYLCFGLSYFFYDLVSMYMVFSSDNQDKVTISKNEIVRFCCERPLIILHHLLVPFVGFPVLIYLRKGQGDCLLGCSFLMEASTPFVSLRVILCHFQKKDSILYLINGLLMLLTFLSCRILIFPYLYYWYATALGYSLIETLTSVPAYCHVALAALAFPQCIWFLKMIKGTVKIVNDLRDKKRKE